MEKKNVKVWLLMEETQVSDPIDQYGDQGTITGQKRFATYFYRLPDATDGARKHSVQIEIDVDIENKPELIPTAEQITAAVKLQVATELQRLSVNAMVRRAVSNKATLIEVDA